MASRREQPGRLLLPSLASVIETTSQSESATVLESGGENPSRQYGESFRQGLSHTAQPSNCRAVSVRRWSSRVSWAPSISLIDTAKHRSERFAGRH
jgi:hypothetical protein